MTRAALLVWPGGPLASEKQWRVDLAYADRRGYDATVMVHSVAAARHVIAGGLAETVVAAYPHPDADLTGVPIEYARPGQHEPRAIGNEDLAAALSARGVPLADIASILGARVDLVQRWLAHAGRRT